MRVFQVGADRFTELQSLPAQKPSGGFLWIGASRNEFEAKLPELQERLQSWEGGPIVELHVADLLNAQLPSQYDYTSWYDLLVFRRLLAGVVTDKVAASSSMMDEAREALTSVDTSPVADGPCDPGVVAPGKAAHAPEPTANTTNTAANLREIPRDERCNITTGLPDRDETDIAP